MVKNVLVCVTTFLCYVSFLFAQKQNNNWYFGKNAGINFNTSPPTAHLNGIIYAREGCSAISDANGNLLFYTSGDTIYDKTFAVMQNGAGLAGGKSSTQAALIVQEPGSNTRYYVFTTGDQESGGTNLAGFMTSGLSYSVVDMSLNGGLGAVDPLFKNVQIFNRAAEKVCATLHANGTDVWIITHDYSIQNSGDGDRFLAYLLSSTGINTTPVISKIGRRHTFYNSINNRFNMIGHLVVSPDGSKLATCVSLDGFAQLFDFDNSTGIVSNAINLGTFSKPYGLCFSPNSQLLYLTTSSAMKRDIANNFQYYRDSLLQFNLLASNIPASKTLIAQEPNRTFGAIQLAPDGKLYIAQLNRPNPTSFFNVDVPSGFLSLVNNPDGLGVACNYALDGFNLSGRVSWLGLPQMLYTQQCNVQLTVNPDTVLCTGNTATLIAGGAADYTWFPATGLSGTNSSTVTATVNGTTTYTVVGSNGTCADTQTVTLYMPNNPLGVSVLNQQDPTCNATNGSITVGASGGFGGYTYSWSPVTGSASTINNLAPGSYQVTVTDTLGCSVTSNIITLNGSAPIQTDIIFAINPSACGATDGFAVVNVISGGQAPFTYSWNTSPPQLDSQLVSVGSGVYVCFITDNLGCQTSDTVQLMDATPVLSLVSVTPPTCFGGNNGAIQISVNPPTSSVIWNNNPGLSGTSINGLTSGIYVGVATDGACTSNIIVEVPSPAELVGTVSVTSNVLCKGDSNGVANGLAVGGTPPYSYIWLPLNIAGNSINNLSAGAYQMVVLDSVGCSDTVSFNISEPANPLNADSAFATNVTCNGLQDGAAQVSVSGGTAPYTFSWVGSTSTGVSATNLGSGNHQVIVTDANGCKDTAYFILSQPDILVATVSASPTSICVGATSAISVSVSGGTLPYSFLWDNGSLTPSITVNPATTTNYSVSVSDANNCSVLAGIAVTVVPSPIVNLVNTDTVCVGGNISITASGGTTYSWFPSAGLNTTNGATVIATPTANTVYYVLVSNSLGCSTLDSVILIVDNTVNAAFTFDPIEPESEQEITFTNQSTTGNLSYAWDFGDNTTISNLVNPAHTYPFEGEYLVILTAINQRGCKDTAMAKITVKDVFEVDIPNVFSPNDDGKNDVWRFIKAKGITNLTCEIYNRWGLRVYTFNGAKGQWEGYNQSGEKCSDGIYYYIVTLTTNTNEKKEYSGYISLVR